MKSPTPETGSFQSEAEKGSQEEGRQAKEEGQAQEGCQDDQEKEEALTLLELTDWPGHTTGPVPFSCRRFRQSLRRDHR